MVPSTEDVRLPSGVMVRLRVPDPADDGGIWHLLAARDAFRVGSAPGPPEGAVVADYPWEGRIVGHASWSRLRGPRATAIVTVARDVAPAVVAAHLIVRLAQLADEALVPALAVTGSESGRLQTLLPDATVVDGGLELATTAWPAARARLDHVRSVPGYVPAVGADGGRGERA
jgi:hypothetical protein